MTAAGLLVVDKPIDWTSHDVVARCRRLFRTRRVGHAGTLDPMATGVLVLGIEGGTKLLTHLVGADKSYVATIRLGQSTTTDDAQGEVLHRADADMVRAVTKRALADGVRALTGQIDQVPSSVSAIKIDGRRAYARVRAGEQVDLPARPVTVFRFDIGQLRRDDDGHHLDVDVEVVCSSGTYIRALARDLGEGLGVGGHLTALRRTRVGHFDLSTAVGPEELAADTAPEVVPLAVAAAQVMPVREVSQGEATELTFGRRIAGHGDASAPIAAIGPDGRLVAILTTAGEQQLRPSTVFAQD